MAAYRNCPKQRVAGPPKTVSFGALGVAAFMAFFLTADRQSAAEQVGDKITYGGTPKTEGAPAFETGTLGWNPILGKTFKEILLGIEDLKPLRLRGATSKRIYATIAPSVVLIASKGITGSGVVVGDNKIVTNAHVVAEDQSVGVIFKSEDVQIAKENPFVFVARVVTADRKTDLALLELPPGAPRRPAVKMGRFEVLAVGDDVHAIGHPVGYNWTYTQGIVSQIRPNHSWNSSGKDHFADVIQTQTPINPGNSGGPLLNDAGELIGINSFVKAGSPGINFAVASSTIHDFLSAKGVAKKAPPLSKAPGCASRNVFTGRTEEDDGWIAVSDQDCNGRPDFSHFVPDDEDKPIIVQMDTFDRGAVDAFIYDVNRDGRWDISYYDVDGDGKLDLTGSHEDGRIVPSSLEAYKPDDLKTSDGSKPK